MADPALIDGRGVAGGPAQPVAIMNAGGTPGTPGGPVQSIQGVDNGKVVVVGGTTFTVTADIQRPNNANIYAQYDIIAHEASGASVIFLSWDTGKLNSSGYITKAKMETDRTAEAAGYLLYLFRVTNGNLAFPLTNLGDNDIFPMKFGNRTNRIGSIPFQAGNWATGGAGSDGASNLVTPSTQGGTLPLKYGCASGDGKIYGLLINPAAGNTPQALQQYSIALSFESNT